MVVYLDLIFILNLMIDAATLHTTAWSRKLQAKTWRIWAAALLGACYVLMMFLPSLSLFYTFIAKTMISVLMMFIAFGYRSMQYFLRNLGAFYMINFVAAGAMIGLHYITQSHSELWNGMLYTRSGGITFQLKVGVIFVLSIFFIALAFYRMTLKSLMRKEKQVHYFAEVLVQLEDVRVRCVGLVDTGNSLYEPITRIPVMIMEAELWRQILPETWMATLNRATTNDMLKLVDDLAFPYPERLRFIPYKGIQQGSSFMLALKPDRVVIFHEGRENVIQRVYVALKGGALSSDASFQAIIHPDLILEERVMNHAADHHPKPCLKSTGG